MVFVGQWHWWLLWVPGLGVICGCGHGFSWLVIWDGWGCGGFPWARVAGSLVVRSGGGFGSEHEHPFVRVCSWGLFPGGMVGGSAAWVLGGGLLRLCLSRVAGWGSPVQCLRLWVALGLGGGGVAGAFVLLNRPCYHDINIKELKFL